MLTFIMSLAIVWQFGMEAQALKGDHGFDRLVEKRKKKKIHTL